MNTEEVNIENEEDVYYNSEIEVSITEDKVKDNSEYNRSFNRPDKIKKNINNKGNGPINKIANSISQLSEARIDEGVVHNDNKKLIKENGYNNSMENVFNVKLIPKQGNKKNTF